MNPPKSAQSPQNPILKWSERILLGFIAAAVLAYLGDCAVFNLRGKPLGRISVNSYLTVPLKGNKTEYDYQGTEPVPCAHALFPKTGAPPCWYLSRHSTHAENL